MANAKPWSAAAYQSSATDAGVTDGEIAGSRADAALVGVVNLGASLLL